MPAALVDPAIAGAASGCQGAAPCYTPAVIANVIFDWSGTLMDDLPAVWRATNHVFRQAGLPEMTLEQFRSEFSLPFRTFYDRFTPGQPRAELEQWFHSEFLLAQESVVEIPHAREFLEFARSRRLRLFVLSSVRRDHYEAQARRGGFDRFIERAYVEIHDKRDVIGQILRENGLQPQETLFVGDMQHDIETARHGGVRSCAVLTGYNRLDQLRASEPDLIVEHLGELQEILDRNALELRPGPATAPAQNAHPLATVGGLIFDDQDRVLMVRTRKWSNLWGIPGGKIKYGETAEHALRRELKEETNLDVKEVEFVLVQDCIRSPEFYREAHFVLLNYTCRCDGSPAVTLNEEAVEFRWVTGGEARQLALNRPTQVLLDVVLAPTQSVE
jgi:phosphoglycolate phosphatase